MAVLALYPNKMMIRTKQDACNGSRSLVSKYSEVSQLARCM